MELDTSKQDWDLSPLLKDESDSAITETRTKTEKEVSKFADKWSNNQAYLENANVLKEVLDEFEKLSGNYFGAGEEGLGETSAYYFWLKSNQNNNDPKTKAKFNKIQEKNKKMEDKMRFFTLNLSKIPEEKQKEFLNNSRLQNYRHFLKRLFESGKHMLSSNEERILSLKEPMANEMWQKMFSSLLLKEERNIQTKEGEKIKNFSEIMGLTHNTDKKTRDSAAKALNNILENNVDAAEAEINAIFANKKVNDELRGFKNPESGRLLTDDLGEETIETLLETISEHYDLARRYYQLKSKLLKLPRLEYHERNVPYGEVEKEYGYKEAIDLTYKVFGQLDKEFAELLKKFSENGQIDVLPKKGKTSGAFCVYWLKSHPTYILLNHTNQLRDVLTLAHEAGHAINNEFTKKKQNALYYGCSTATAEVASTFMEDFVLEELLKEADEELKLTLLMQKLNEDITTVIRQIACYKFERELHKKFRERGYLSKEEIGKIFQKHMGDYMGTGVELSEGSENWWASWIHIRMFFYTYSYASGLLISKALQNKVKENPEFIGKVKEFLSAGISESPENIFKSLGIDITKKEFWLKGLKEIENLLDETENLAKKMNKF